MIIDCAVYRNGKREDTSHDVASLENALASLTEKNDFIWIGAFEPSAAELAEIAAPLKLHPLAVEDAVEAHQRPKVERYADHLFMSIKTVTYDNDDIQTAEINAFLGSNYLLTVRHGKGHDLRAVRHRAETQEHELEHGPTAALYAVVDSVVDDYEHVAAELEIDVQEVESSVFSLSRTSDSSRIYRLKREALEFRRAVMPLREPVNRFAAGAMPEDARPYFRDIGDHLSRVAESIDATDHLLDNALHAHIAQLSIQQNDDMRKLAAGATLFAVPTAIAGIYGMNFDHMPELTWTYGYPMVLGAMLFLCIYIVWRFKKSGWL
ncbi:MAG: magnesium/cobalt transporter CorA [Actinomycetota bacterium]|nr:magnesium/cobalt transporter CorA [Actinomycetota bacterium]